MNSLSVGNRFSTERLDLSAIENLSPNCEEVEHKALKLSSLTIIGGLTPTSPLLAESVSSLILKVWIFCVYMRY